MRGRLADLRARGGADAVAGAVMVALGLLAVVAAALIALF